jgi:hypothetical protein
MFFALIAVGSAAWAAPAHSGVGNLAVSLGGISPGKAAMLLDFFSSITEPVGLVLMGICLIALSVLLRKRLFRKSDR